MAAEQHAPSSGEYIVHHLTHWRNKEFNGTFDLTVFSIDSLLFSVLLGVIGCFLLWRVATRRHLRRSGPLPGCRRNGASRWSRTRPSRIVHNAQSAASSSAPLALTVFIWIFLMNSMDFLPVDLLARACGSQIYGATGHDPHHAYLRVVPTADLSATLGHVARRCCWCASYYNIKIKGLGGWDPRAVLGARSAAHPAAVAVQLR
jgi:F-type H+-transporting ATPase subunit a